MFAGPNGSGKSTLFRETLPRTWSGIYLNPDEIEAGIRTTGVFDPRLYGVSAGPEEVLAHLRGSALLQRFGHAADIGRITAEGEVLRFAAGTVSAYHASAASDFLRHRLLTERLSFTFETVMSSRDKVDFLAAAQRAGFRTYLYFIATVDPQINQGRIEERVEAGGHDVPLEKVAPRYWRSLELLSDAIRYSNRAYIFDNSGPPEMRTWLAEITDGKSIELKEEFVPDWFKTYVIDRLDERLQGPASGVRPSL